MGWQAQTEMDQKRAFVVAYREGLGSVETLAPCYGVSPATGYRLLARVEAEGEAGLAQRSRRPQTSPRQLTPEEEAPIVALRQAHPGWGGRKLLAALKRQGAARLPSPSTITSVLRRHGLIEPAASAAARPWQRFEAAAPNLLWQLDAKGPLAQPARHHLLPLLDDHSRYLVDLALVPELTRATVQPWLTRCFERVGCPVALLVDNGSPWGTAGPVRQTRLTAWLLRHEIAVLHSRPRHPQTLGKVERLHRTYSAELLRGPLPADLAAAQALCHAWQASYNAERPHEALGFAVPAERWHQSLRPWPSEPPPWAYLTTDTVRRVQQGGRIHVFGRVLRVGAAFVGDPIALRPTLTDGVWELRYHTTLITTIKL